MMEIQRRITKSYFDLTHKKYMPLIQKLAFKIGMNSMQIEELKIRAIEELLKCMICYDNRCSFITFLYSRLNGIFRHIRCAEIRANRVKVMPIESMKNIPAISNAMDSHIMADEYMEYLNKDEHNVIVELFFNNKTMREIASDNGIVLSTVWHIKNRAIKKMRNKCGV